jgi:hypothetical protein
MIHLNRRRHTEDDRVGGGDMEPFSMVLDLSKHCIETELRIRYHRRLSDYFKAGGDRERIEWEIEMLKAWLERGAFERLRNRHKALAGGSRARVEMRVGPEGKAALLIDDRVAARLPVE